MIVVTNNFCFISIFQHPDGFLLPDDTSGASDNSHRQRNHYRSPPTAAQVSLCK